MPPHIARFQSLEFRFTARMTIVVAAFLGLSILGLYGGNQLVSEIRTTRRIAEVLSRYSDYEARLRPMRVGAAQLTGDSDAGVADAAGRRAAWDRAAAEWRDRPKPSAPLDLPGRIGMLERRALAAEVRFSGVADGMVQPDAGSGPRRAERFRRALQHMERRSDMFRHALRDELVERMVQGQSLAQRALVQLALGLALMLILGSVLVLWLRWHIVHPLMRIVMAVRAMNAGRSLPPLESGARSDELGELTRALQSLFRAGEERERAQREVAFLAHHDPLTGLANRFVFAGRLTEALQAGARVALLAIDLDGFKGVNDTLGHAMGDEMLKRTSALLLAVAERDDVVARIGGDEFAILHHLPPDAQDASGLAQRLFAGIAADPESPAIRMSIGIALSQRHAVESDELHACADIALYRAKADGRHCARHYDLAMDEERRQRHWLAHELREAVTRGELHLAYQPIADCCSRRVIGQEALARWTHPVLGPVSPDVFIGLAEEGGLIGEIGQRLFGQALATARTWPADWMLAINLSPVQLRDPQLAGRMLATIATYGMDPRRIEVEVTEGVLIDHRETATANLARLRGEGVRIVMDDFGTGYSSLSSLQQFPFDKIKIDRSFIQAMDVHGPSLSIVRASIGLGRSLNVPIVAEGVETDDQHRTLCDLGCDQIQGYLIGRPSASLPRAA